MRAASASLLLVLCAAVSTATGDLVERTTEGPPPPALGHYSVKNEKGVTCLLAELAARLLLQNSPQHDNTPLKIFNINPNVTHANGSCSENKAQLRLEFSEGFVQLEMKKVNGIAVASSIEAHLNYNSSDKYQVFHGKVDNLEARMSPADKSYICKVEQAINLSEGISVSASNLHLQAFGLQNNTFSSASECSMDPAILARKTNTTNHNPLIPKPPPMPPVGKYNVSSKEKVCALFDFSLLVVVNYTTNNNKTTTGYVPVFPNVTRAGGLCNKTHTMLSLHNKNGSFNFTFAKRDNGGVFILQNITVQLNLSFPSTKPASYNASNSSLHMFNASIGKAYLCHVTETVQLDSKVGLRLNQVHVQPFDVKEGKFSEPNECSMDTPTPAPTTIAPTTIAPTPKPPPMPPVGKYNVSSKENVCALFDFSLLVVVNYTTKNNKTTTGYVPVFPNVTTAGGLCNKTHTMLSLCNKNGSFNFTFTKRDNGGVFILQNITVQLNLSFPSTKPASYNASNSSLHMFHTSIGKAYLCHVTETVQLDSKVGLRLNQVHVQPFDVKGGKFSEPNECSMDTTTPAPTTIAPTTIAPTTIAPTPKPPPMPPVGKYNVSSKENVCALFDFSLLVVVNYTTKNNKTTTGYVPVLSNVTTAGGLCNKTHTMLFLHNKNGSFNFTFTKNDTTNKFILKGISTQVNYSFPSAKPGTYHGANTTLQLFRAKVGNSYMCEAKKTVTLSSGIALDLSNIHLQPFDVKKEKFGTAENCALDIAGLLIPIIVGAVLALLLFIVLIIYVIGRRRSHAGYQAI
uniref:uncharacterized protein isoform X2 n=1 Tax=Myxine glutinosa TaxID=7769 RepID=UPI00358F5B99